MAVSRFKSIPEDEGAWSLDFGIEDEQGRADFRPEVHRIGNLVEPDLLGGRQDEPLLVVAVEEVVTDEEFLQTEFDVALVQGSAEVVARKLAIFSASHRKNSPDPAAFAGSLRAFRAGDP